MRGNGTKVGTHARWNSFYARKVTFVLADVDHKIILTRAVMKVRVKKAEHDRNIYEGDVTAAWRALPSNARALEFIGVLYADGQREFAGDINWVEDTNPATVDTPARAVPAT